MKAVQVVQFGNKQLIHGPKAYKIIGQMRSIGVNVNTYSMKQLL